MPGGVVAPLELVLQWQTDAFPHGIRAPPALTIISVVFTALALVTTLARCYDRLIIRHNAGLDDALVAIALIPQIGLCIATCLAEQRYGFDRHAWDITPDLAPKSRKITMATSLLYMFSTTLTKISILCFYRRLGAIRPWFKWTIWASIAYVAGYTLTFVVAIPLECRPINAYWNKVNPIWAFSHEYKCINEGAGNVAAGAISASQDFIACILPMAIFWDLRLSKHAKMALAAVFSLGLFTCICGLLRTIQLYRIFFQTYDTTWAARWPYALTLVESSLGLICGSIPALKSSLHRLFASVLSSATETDSRTGSRQWKNPFFRSNRRSMMYVNWSGSDDPAARKERGGPHPAARRNMSIGGSSFSSSNNRKSVPPKSISETELSPMGRLQEEV